MAGEMHIRALTLIRTVDDALS